MMHSLSAVAQAVEIPPQATSDAGMIALWLGNYRSPNTRGAYGSDVQAFARVVGKPLRETTLHDVQAFAASIGDMAPATVARRLSSVKSLVGFAHRLGYLAFDVAAPVQLPAIKDDLAQKILTEWQVQRMLELERHPRNAAVLRLLYSSGMRVSELCGLCWRDLLERDEGGQITVLGKGGKTRAILLPPPIWIRIRALRGAAEPDGPVFLSRQKGPLDRSGVHRIVKRAAIRAKLPPMVSAHWLRHAHASHALDRAAPVHVVQATLGHASLSTTTRYTHVRPGDSSAKYLVA
jgi:integrase/recombinase XerD